MDQDARAGAADARPHPAHPEAGDDPHRRAWLHLGHAPGSTPRLHAALRRHEPDARALGAALQALIDGDDALVRPGGPLQPAAAAVLRAPAAHRAADTALEWESRAADRHLLTLGSCAYPDAVACLDDAPPALALRGDPAALLPPGLAIVGSRRATRRGLDRAREYGADFANNGFSIVSGLAHGIDAAAHAAALEADGVTIAVVATGPDRVYPARHANLAARIAGAGGAVIAEHPCRFELRPHHFPWRNRLVTALSLGTLIIEAANPSGTLGTAAHANAQSRAVMALPGLPGDPAHAGCHRLVREGGATLVAGPEDVAAVLAGHLRLLLDAEAREAEIRRRLQPLADSRNAAASAVHVNLVTRLDERLRAAPAGVPEATARDAALADLDETARRVHAALGDLGRDAGALSAAAHLGVGRTAAALARLELAGLAVRDGAGGYVRCRAPRT